MICKDCLSCDVCYRKYNYIQEEWQYGELIAQNYRENIENICGCFKDKSKFIELPCKVGDKVYYIYESSNFQGYHKYILKTNKICSIEIQKHLFFYFTCDRSALMSDDYNKTWFTDKSKAEAKLKELNNG